MTSEAHQPDVLSFVRAYAYDQNILSQHIEDEKRKALSERAIPLLRDNAKHKGVEHFEIHDIRVSEGEMGLYLGLRFSAKANSIVYIQEAFLNVVEELIGDVSGFETNESIIFSGGLTGSNHSTVMLTSSDTRSMRIKGIENLRRKINDRASSESVIGITIHSFSENSMNVISFVLSDSPVGGIDSIISNVLVQEFGLNIKHADSNPMDTYSVKLQADNRIQIPSEVLNGLGIETGSQFSLTVLHGNIVLTPGDNN